MASRAIEEEETPYQSPCKVGGTTEYFEEGMKVMFHNNTNVDMPAFAIGTLEECLDDDRRKFKITWETKGVDPWEDYQEHFNNVPFIIHPDRKDQEIIFRELVHQTRLLAYSARIRKMVGVTDKSLKLVSARLIRGLHIESVGYDLTPLELTEIVENHNRETCNLMKNEARATKEADDETEPKGMYIPAEIYNEAQIRVVERLKQIEQFATLFPGVKTPDELKEENIDPLLKWVYEQSKIGLTEERKESVAKKPPPKPDYPTTPPAKHPKTPPSAKSDSARKGVPKAVDIPSVYDLEDSDDDDDRKPAATTLPPELANMGISNIIPQCQNIDKVAGIIRKSAFGSLRLEDNRVSEPQKIKELKDLEVVIAYATYLLMIIGRLTTSNVGVDSSKDWFATKEKFRRTFINGFYGAWYNRESTWSKNVSKRFRLEDTENGFLAALGSLRASAIGANDEIFLRALNNGNRMEKKTYYQLVGHPKVKKVNTDMQLIIQQPHTFEEAEGKQGRLYDSIVNILHNGNRTREFRVESRTVNVDMSTIHPEVERATTTTTTKPSSATKRKPKSSADSVAPHTRRQKITYVEESEGFESDGEGNTTDSSELPPRVFGK